VLPGDHPLPSERGVESARRVLDAAERAGPDDLVLAVITGGGSALLAAPADPISVGDLRALTSALLTSGASIDEINAVRKHCSAVKGGQLARCRPRDDRHPRGQRRDRRPARHDRERAHRPRPSTYADALAVLDRYDLDAPDSVRERLRAGADGELPETPTAGDPAFDRSAAFVVGNGRTALDAAATAAADRGYEPLVLSASVRGEAREAGTTHAAIAEECAARGSPIEPPAVLLSGGETTVTLGDAADPGTGGPNAEFAASAGLALAEGPLGTEAGAEEGTTTATATAPPSRRRERRHRRARRPDRRRRSYRGRDDARPRRRPRRPRPPRRVPTLRRRGRAPADRSDRNERQRPAGDRRGEAGWRGGT